MASNRSSAVEMNKKQAAVLADDSDLDDLLAGGKAGDSTETAPLNLDHLTQGKLDVPRRQARFNAMSYTDILSAYCNYLCYQYPTLCVCVALSFILLFVIVLVNATFNPTEEFGVIKQNFSDIGNDLTNIRSEFVGKLSKIDHWCLNGGNEGCRCEDPLSPQSRAEFKTWVDIYKKNKREVIAYKDSNLLDVAFLGESLVEEMDGRWLGRDDSDELKAIKKIFKKRFKKQEGPDNVEGVALGIAGDTTPNVLWRIMHGEMPNEFNPKVWWVSLGMNDLGRSQCSEEVVVIGILRVVEEIRSRKPGAHIVINSLLPMADLRGGLFPLVTDYRDAFRKSRGQRDPPVEASRYVPKTQAASSSEGTQGETKDNKIGKMPKGSNRPIETKAPKAGKDSSRQLTEYNGRVLKRRKEKVEKSQEELDEAALRREKRLEAHRLRRDPFNPKLNPYQHKMRKYDAHKLFLKKNRLPLWTSISAINDALKKFCSEHKDVTFFDATEIFAERGDDGQYVLLSDRISIRGHPTILGFKEWEDKIVAILKKLLPKIKKDSPTKTTQTPQQKDSSDNLNIRQVTSPPKKSKEDKDEEKKSDDKEKGENGNENNSNDEGERK